MDNKFEDEREEALYQKFKRRFLNEIMPTDEMGNTGNWEVEEELKNG